MPEVRWTFPPMAVTPPRPAPPVAAPLPAPVQITSHGYLLRTLVPADATPHFVQWINAPAMRVGLNLPDLKFDEAGLRRFIATFDGLHNHLIGIFENDLLLGFYTLDVNPTHRVASITAGLGADGSDRRKVYWSTIDALLDHFFIYRNIDKIIARVLSGNKAMLFNFVDNSRFVFEAKLEQECMGPDGKRHDVLSFAAFREGKRPDGRGYMP